MERAMHPRRGSRVLFTSMALGLLAGVALFVEGIVASTAVDAWGVGSWVLGASLALIPATVAAGWAGLVLHLRSHPRWLRVAAGVALVEIALSLAFATTWSPGPIDNLSIGGIRFADVMATMVPLGDGTTAIGLFVDLFVLLLMLAVPVVAGLISVPGRPTRGSLGWHLAGGLAWVGMIALTYLFIIRFLVVFPG